MTMGLTRELVESDMIEGTELKRNRMSRWYRNVGNSHTIYDVWCTVFILFLVECIANTANRCTWRTLLEKKKQLFIVHSNAVTQVCSSPSRYWYCPLSATLLSLSYTISLSSFTFAPLLPIIDDLISGCKLHADTVDTMSLVGWSCVPFPLENMSQMAPAIWAYDFGSLQT